VDSILWDSFLSEGVDYSTLYRAAEEAALRGGKPLQGGVVGVAMNLYSDCSLPSTENKNSDL